MSANPRTNGETCVPLVMPPLEPYAVKVDAAGDRTRGVDTAARPADARPLSPEPDALPATSARTSRTATGWAPSSRRRSAPSCSPSSRRTTTIGPEGRVMEVLSEHNCEGWLEGYALTGRHGLLATYESFAMVMSSMAIQHAKWLDESAKLEWRKPVPVAEHPPHLHLLAQRPQRLQSPGTGLHRHHPHQEAGDLAHLPPARRQLPALDGGPLLPHLEPRQRRRHRQAAAAPVPRSPVGEGPLRARGLGLGVGEQRRGRPGRGDGLRRRHPHHGDAGRDLAAAHRPHRACASGW